MSDQSISISARGVDLEALLKEFTERIGEEWPGKWTGHGEQYRGVEGLPSKNAFYHDLADALNETYKNRYGLSAAAEKEIKVHTLRRVLEPGAFRNYDDKTCDVLVVYLGYANWAAYRMRDHAMLPSPIQRNQIRRRTLWVTLAGIVLLVMVTGTWLYSSQDENIPADNERLKLISASSTKAPAKLVVRYDLRGLDPSQALVVGGGNSVVPQLEQGVLTFELMLAQAVPISLFVSNKLVCQIPVVIDSDGWEGYLNLSMSLEKSTFYHEGLLHFPANLVPKDKRDDYYPAFLNFHDYGLSADAMHFEARVLNNEKIGGQWAYDVSVDLIGTKHRAYFNVLAPDATLYAHAGVAETEFKGSENHNLKNLGITLDDWCVLGMYIKDYEAVILINEKEALRIPYREALGDLRGIQFYMKGSGAVDWVRVTDLKDGQVKFFDDFLGNKIVASAHTPN